MQSRWNKLIPDYMDVDVDVDVVWETVQEDIPLIKSLIQNIDK